MTDTYNHSEDNGENNSKQDQGNGLNRSLPSKLSKEVRDEENQQHQQMLETLNNVVRIMGTAASTTGDMSMAMAPSSEKEIDDGSGSKSLVARVVNLMQISKNNADVITQAFRFVRLDAHLSTLLSQVHNLHIITFFTFSNLFSNVIAKYLLPYYPFYCICMFLRCF